MPAPPVTSTRAISGRRPGRRRRPPSRRAAPPSRRRTRTPARCPGCSTDRPAGSRRRRSARISRSVSGCSNSEWLVATITTSASRTASASGCVGVAACGSQTATSASSRSSRRISLGDSESRSSSVSRLKVSPSTATLREERLPMPALDPLDQEQRHALVDARDRQQHAGRVGALLGEGEVLAQAGAGGQAGHRDAAAGIVVVDQVDDLEHVGPVALAVHHQQVGQREGGVAQDVGPDLGQLGLHRRGLDDRRAEHAEQAGGVARWSSRRRRR